MHANIHQILRGGALLALLALVAALHAPAAAATAGALDGQTFQGQVGEKDETDGDADTFVFADGTFRSAACDAYGFTATPYTASAEGEATRFEAVATSEKEGTMTWKGTVAGDAIEGTAVWEKPDQAPMEYWFEGTLAPPAE